MTLGQAFNLHLPMYTSDFTTLSKNSAVKIVYWLKKYYIEKVPSMLFRQFP